MTEFRGRRPPDAATSRSQRRLLPGQRDQHHVGSRSTPSCRSMFTSWAVVYWAWVQTWSSTSARLPRVPRPRPPGIDRRQPCGPEGRRTPHRCAGFGPGAVVRGGRAPGRLARHILLVHHQHARPLAEGRLEHAPDLLPGQPAVPDADAGHGDVLDPLGVGLLPHPPQGGLDRLVAGPGPPLPLLGAMAGASTSDSW